MPSMRNVIVAMRTRPWILGAITCLLSGSVSHAQGIYVYNGDVQSNSTATTADQVVVTGTYSANAPLTTGYLQVGPETGVFNVNSNVQANWLADVLEGGQIRLNSGTLSGGGLRLSGSSAIARNGGALSTDNLVVGNGSFAVESGDSFNNLAIVENGEVSLQRNLSLTWLELQSTGSLVPNGFWVESRNLSLTNQAQFTFDRVDVFGLDNQINVYGGGLLTLQADLETNSVNVSQGSALFRQGQGALDVNNLLFVAGDSTAVLRGNDSINQLSVRNGGYVHSYGPAVTSILVGSMAVDGIGSSGNPSRFLADGLAVTLPENNVATFADGARLDIMNGSIFTADYLGFSGSASLWMSTGARTVSQSLQFNDHSSMRRWYGGTISTRDLSITNSSTASFANGDSVSGSIYVLGGSQLQLAANLAASNLFVSGPGSSLVRNGHSFSIAQTLGVSGSGVTVTFSAGDQAGLVSVGYGGTIVLEGDLNAGFLELQNEGNLQRQGHGINVNGIRLSNGAAFTLRPEDTISQQVYVNAGSTLTLGRDLTLRNPSMSGLGLFMSGTGSSLITNGHTYDMEWLDVTNNATFHYTEGNTVERRVTVSGGGTLEVDAPLSLGMALDVYPTGTVDLNSFTQSWSGGYWGLRVSGNNQTALQNYVTNNLIRSGDGGGEVTVVYDAATNATYVSRTQSLQAVTTGTATITGTATGTVVVSTPGATAQFAGTVTGTVTASNGGAVVITGSVAPTAQVSVGNGSTVTIGNGGAVAQPVLTNAGKFAVANTVGSILLPSTITGNGSFEKTGAGTAVLTGSSSFTGGTTISSGVVSVQNAKALGSGGVTVGSGGTLLVDGIDLDLGGAAVALGVGAELQTTSGARVTISGSSDLSGVRSSSPGSTSAAILAGTAISGTLATTWTTTADAAVKSAVLELKTPTTAANPFVLSLTYALGLDSSGLFLGWNDPVSDEWVNAVVGNELLPGMTAASAGQLGYLGSFAAFQSAYGTNLSSYLGAYGRDGAGHTVWAVVNHNSEFAVTEINPVPEPSTWALALAGIAGVVLAVRRKPAGRRAA